MVELSQADIEVIVSSAISLLGLVFLVVVLFLYFVVFVLHYSFIASASSDSGSLTRGDSPLAHWNNAVRFKRFIRRTVVIQTLWNILGFVAYLVRGILHWTDVPFSAFCFWHGLVVQYFLSINVAYAALLLFVTVLLVLKTRAVASPVPALEVSAHCCCACAAFMFCVAAAVIPEVTMDSFGGLCWISSEGGLWQRFLFYYLWAAIVLVLLVLTALVALVRPTFRCLFRWRDPPEALNTSRLCHKRLRRWAVWRMLLCASCLTLLGCASFVVHVLDVVDAIRDERGIRMAHAVLMPLQGVALGVLTAAVFLAQDFAATTCTLRRSRSHLVLFDNLSKLYRKDHDSSSDTERYFQAPTKNLDKTYPINDSVARHTSGSGSDTVLI